MPFRLLRPSLISLLLFSPLAALAQESSAPNVDPLGAANPSPAARLWLAHRLYAQGVADQDGISVLAAARMAASVPQVKGGEIEKSTSGKAVEAAAGRNEPTPIKDMLETARNLAKGDDVSLTLIDQAKAIGDTDRTDVAVVRDSDLSPGQTDIWTLSLFGGSAAEIAIIGDNDSNLDLHVTDENGNTICAESGPQDLAFCGFVPAHNGFFKISVTNFGPGINSYLFVTN